MLDFGVIPAAALKQATELALAVREVASINPLIIEAISRPWASTSFFLCMVLLVELLPFVSVSIERRPR